MVNSSVVFVFLMIQSLKINVLVLKHLKNLIANSRTYLFFYLNVALFLNKTEPGLALIEISYQQNFLGRFRKGS